MKMDFVIGKLGHLLFNRKDARRQEGRKEIYSKKEVLIFTHLCTRPVLNSGLR